MPLSVSLWNDLSDPVFNGVGLAGFKSGANAFLLARSALYFLSPTVLSFSSFHGLVVWGWGLWLIECPHSLPALHSGLQNNNINNNKVLSQRTSWTYCTDRKFFFFRRLIVVSMDYNPKKTNFKKIN